MQTPLPNQSSGKIFLCPSEPAVISGGEQANECTSEPRSYRHICCGDRPFEPKRGTSSTSSSVQHVADDQPATVNIAHDRLSALDPASQTMTLAALVSTPDDQCTGEKTFFMGMNPEDNGAFWSVACSNGKSYHLPCCPLIFSAE